MSKQAQITVIVPVYNRAELMIRTLDSIAAQSLRPFELIVVDNNSTDNTLEVLHEWKEQNESADFVVTIKQEPRAGACCARNKGLEAVKTPYVMFFDSDDTMIPTHIESALQALQADKSLDIVGWDVTVNLLDGKAVKKRFSVNDVLYNHIFHSSFATLRYAARTDLIRAVGCWNEAIAGWNDYELGVRIALKNPRMLKLTEGVGVNVYSQATSITGTNFSSTPGKWEAALDSCEASLRRAGKADFVKWIETRRAILAGMYRKEGDKANSDRLLSQVVGRTTNWRQRTFYRFVCRFIVAGGRGVAILAKMFL